MKSGHRTIELVPADYVAGGLMYCVKIEPCHAPRFMVSVVAELIAGHVDGEMTVAFVVGVLCTRRGRLGEKDDRRGERQARSSPAHFSDAFAVLHRGPLLLLLDAIPELRSEDRQMSKVSSLIAFWPTPHKMIAGRNQKKP
jgi:hypothetical protein